jgi:hypothetical protein
MPRGILLWNPLLSRLSELCNYASRLPAMDFSNGNNCSNGNAIASEYPLYGVRTPLKFALRFRFSLYILTFSPQLWDFLLLLSYPGWVCYLLPSICYLFDIYLCHIFAIYLLFTCVAFSMKHTIKLRVSPIGQREFEVRPRHSSG